MGAYVNSQNAKFDKSYVSCGVTEMHHLPDKSPQVIMFCLATHLYHKANPRPAAFVIFSDIISANKSRGECLSHYIREKAKFGALLSTGQEINPKTGNVIQVWTLQLDHDSFRAWFVEETMHRLASE